MSPERRYSDEEVAEIFARATETQSSARRQVPPGDGTTLAELQEIGREVGIDPHAVERAAHSLDQPHPPRTGGVLGIPLSVAHSVELGYRMTNEQWERLVVDLRHTFDAAGRVRSEGSFRTWSNGNLQVLVEPSVEGDRVRFRTMKGSARSLMATGAVMFAVSLIILVVGVVSGDATSISEALRDVATVMLVGAGLVGIGVAQVPGWAKLRRQQMEEIGDRLLQWRPPRQLPT
jgi:hypothetical protein